MAEEQIKRDTIAQVLEGIYLLLFVLFVAYAFLQTTMFDISWPKYFYRDLRVLLLVVIFLRAGYVGNYTKREVILIALIGTIFLLDYNRMGANTLYDMLLLILGARGISFRKLLSVYLFITAGLLFIANIASLTGGTENLRYYYGERTRRFAMGIVYPTDFAAHVFFCVASYIYLRGERIKYLELIGLCVLDGILYWLTDARTCSACIFLLIAVIIYHKIRITLANKKNLTYKMNSIWSLLLALSPVLCGGFITVATSFYSENSRFWVLIDKILNTRLSLGHKALEVYGFSFWGKSIPSQGNGGTIEKPSHYFYLDSSYIRILLLYGLWIFVCVLLIVLVITFQARLRKEWILLWILSVVAVESIMEHHILQIAYNPFLMYLLADIGQIWSSPGWMNKRKMKKKEHHNAEQIEG